MKVRRTKEIKFTKKEAYLMWSIITWFAHGKDRITSSSLNYKLYELGKQLGVDDIERNRLNREYDVKIHDRIVDITKFFKELK